MKKKKIIFRYNKETKKGFLISNGRKTGINAGVPVYNIRVSSGCAGYGIHLI